MKCPIRGSLQDKCVFYSKDNNIVFTITAYDDALALSIPGADRELYLGVSIANKAIEIECDNEDDKYTIEGFSYNVNGKLYWFATEKGIVDEDCIGNSSEPLFFDVDIENFCKLDEVFKEESGKIHLN